MNKYICSVLVGLACLYGSSLQAQTRNYDASLIADSLQQGVLSVIRCNDLTFTQSSPTTGTCQYRLAVTILSDAGQSHANWVGYTDSYCQLGSFEGRIYDASGKLLKKIKQKELSLSEYSEHLMSDGRRYYYMPDKQVSYPFTVEYVWEEKLKNGIDAYVNHSPIMEIRQSSEDCHFEIIVPGDEVRTLARNTDAQWTRTDEGTQVRYSFTMPPFRGIQIEDMLPRLSAILPVVNASRIDFSRNGYAGRLERWEDLGDWALQLWQERQELPAAEMDTIRALTDTLSNDRDKIDALYKYLARKTRYVSIQLGIGGWQPMKAAEVARVGFGDCKALSNYMHSMLRQIGITSYPVIIGTRHERYIDNYPNFFQNDHCILCVPQASDSLWIDCTAAATLPLGVIGGSLRGHDCILLRPEGAQLARVPNPTPAWITTAHITIGDDLKSDCKAVETDYIGKENTIKKDYGKVLGGRTLLFPIDPYTSIYQPKFRKGSTYPIEREKSVCYIDTLHFHLAEGVVLESVPDLSDASTLNNRLPLNDEPVRWQGSGMLDDWQVEMAREESGIRVVVVLHRKSGTLPYTSKPDFAEQCKQIADIFNAKLIFKKKN